MIINILIVKKLSDKVLNNSVRLLNNMKILPIMKRFFLFLIFCCLGWFSNQSYASHYYGSDISYTCLGGNQYEIKVRYYADCGSGGMGASMVLAANSSCVTNQNIFLSLTTTQATDVTPVCPTTQTSCNGGTGSFGIDMYEYTGTATLAACSDWVIDYNSCCRNASATNLNFPTTFGHYVYTLLDNINQPCNNSPQIAAAPDMIACVSDTLYSSANAFDPDGDSLVYSLTNCLDNSTTAAVTYNTGFSGTAPFTGSTSIDPQTGLITLVPTVTHSGYICVMIEEYRNGTKINETVKDYIIHVQNCTNTIPKVHQINGGNIAVNSQFTAMAGTPLNLDFYVYDAEVQVGTQTLSATLQNNLSNINTTLNGSTFNVTWTPTMNDIGTHFLEVHFEDDNCPFIGQSNYVVKVEVLGLPFVNAIDDAFFGMENTPLSGNVALNDLSSSNISINSTPISNPSNGVIVLNTDGSFTYTPNQSFTGLDSLKYEAFISNLFDTATVYINIQPTIIPTLNISDTIVLGESYPNYYCLTDSATYVSDTLNNSVLTFVNDSCFTIYGDYLGTDTVTLASANEVVNFYITVVNGVWPGDTDDDALVNNVDLLNIGLAYNTIGVPRSSQSIQWNGYLADDWSMTFPNGLNAKHADANGDGTINANDTMAIVQNWGLTYNKNGGGNGATIYLETAALTITNDSIITIPIMLGNAQSPVSSIYGLAFSVTYNWELVKDGTAYISFDSTWLGTNQNMIAIQKDFYNNEIIEAAVTRIDGNNVNGFGQIGTLGFTIQDDIIRGGDSLFSFNVLNIQAVESDASTVDLQGQNQDIYWQTLIDIANNTQNINLSNHINIYPNPATDFLNIETKSLQIETIEIYDLTGRQILQNQNLINNKLEISTLSNGFYIVHIKTNLGVWNEKIMVVKP